MDLIYTDKNAQELGVLDDYKLDLAYGENENDFELTVNINNNVCEPKSFIYIEGTEYGGIIDTLTVDTGSGEIHYKGRTWQGIMASKVIQPPAGEDYYSETMVINYVVFRVVRDIALQSIFRADRTAPDTYVPIKMDRYTDAYKGLYKKLKEIGYKMVFRVAADAMVNIYTKPISVYDDDIISEKVDFNITKKYNPPNHVICLGKGELKDRTVKHLYADADGNISETQTYTGIDEVTIVYDYANAESEEELLKGGREKLLEARADSVEVDLKSDDIVFDIGDRIIATEHTTGITVDKAITKKIVTINKGIVSINYKVGE